MRQWILCLLLIPSICLGKVSASRLLHLSIKPNESVTILHFQLDKKTMGYVYPATNANGLFIEFTHTKQTFYFNTLAIMHANVSAIASEKIAHDGVRFRVTTKGKVNWTTQFAANSHDGYTLQIKIQTQILPKQIILLQRQFKQDVMNDRLLKTRQYAFFNAQKTNAQTNIFNREKLHFFTIVIDPGHGGKDTGARGFDGVNEKDIVFAIANRLAAHLNQDPMMRALLTRHNDYFVPLRARIALAKQQQADLFISIHADASFDSVASGASVYALSQHGAINEAARILLNRENNAAFLGMEENMLQDDHAIQRSILIDLTQATTINDSLHLGGDVLKTLQRVAELHHAHVVQAPFVVLKSIDIPSVLIETGFISNPTEEKELSDPAYQEKLAEAIALGIGQYFKSQSNSL